MQIRRIGIALAVYEPTIDYLVEQLVSLREQTFSEWSCAITFDSPAGPVVAHRQVSPILADPRFRWNENERRLGAAKNFERAIQLCLADSVDAVACCDYDDRWYPDKLETLRRALMAQRPLSLVHSDLDVLVGGAVRGSTWRIERRRPDHVAAWQLILRNVVTGCSMLMDAELARRYPVVPPQARLHDRWYALAASCHGGVHPVPRALMAYRQHGANDTGLAPYRGLFAYPAGVSTPRELVAEVQRVWRTARGLARAAIELGLAVPASVRSLYVSRADVGAGLAVRAIRHVFDDPVLARAALAAALGKASETLPAGKERE